MAIKNDETTQTTIEKYVNNLNVDAVGNDALVVPPLIDLNNTNRTILQIVNANQTEPMMAKANYNIETQKIEIEVTYTKNGIAKIIDEEGKTLSENSNTAETGTEIELGEHTYIIIDTEKNMKEVKATKSKPKPIIIAASDYGKLVTNYSAGGVDSWRIFHQDEEGKIYLIADDYVPYTSLPTTRGGTLLTKGSTNYKAHWSTTALSDYTGSAWIRENTNTNAQKWLNTYLTAYPNSTDNNMKAVAYMMDTNVWGKFVNTTYAEYAIGGPTLELFCASYKVTHPDKYIECDSVNSRGYKVKYNTDELYSQSVTGLTYDNYNGIYIKSSKTNASGMWLASPSNIGSITGGDVMCDGYTSSENGYVKGVSDSYLSNGFRPLVCLNSKVQLIDNGNGTFRIQ